jgi:hypothetical protein
VAFFVASYLCGGVLAVAILCFRKRKQKEGRVRPTHSLRRLGTIALAAALAGSIVCMMATRIPAPAKHALNYVCFAPALLLAVLLLVNFRVTKDEDREWWGRSGAWILITILGWIVFNVMVLWGAQAITATTGNQLAVFLGHVEANPVAKALFVAFVGVTGIVAGLLVLRHKRINTLGDKVGFQWLLIVVAVVFFVLLSIVMSWVLVLLGAQPWVYAATAWLLGGPLQIANPNFLPVQLFFVVFGTGAMLLFVLVIGFFFNANKSV